MTDFEHTEAIIGLILTYSPRKDIPATFERTVTGVLENPVLTEILSETDVALKERITKLAYARKMLSSEAYEVIGEGNITAEWMTLEKIFTLAEEDETTAHILGGWMSLELIQAVTGEFLAHIGMSADKITLIARCIPSTVIKEYWAQKIAEMSEDDFTETFMDYFC